LRNDSALGLSKLIQFFSKIFDHIIVIGYYWLSWKLFHQLSLWLIYLRAICRTLQVCPKQHSVKIELPIFTNWHKKPLIIFLISNTYITITVGLCSNRAHRYPTEIQNSIMEVSWQNKNATNESLYSFGPFLKVSN